MIFTPTLVTSNSENGKKTLNSFLGTYVYVLVRLLLIDLSAFLGSQLLRSKANKRRISTNFKRKGKKRAGEVTPAVVKKKKKKFFAPFQPVFHSCGMGDSLKKGFFPCSLSSRPYRCLLRGS